MIPPDPATPRPGPRPLALHLMISHAASMTSPVGLALSKPGWTPWAPEMRAAAAAAGQAPSEAARLSRQATQTATAALADPQLAAAAAALAAHPPGDVAAALLSAIAEQQKRFLDGLTAYRRHPYRRALADPPTLWQEGATRLLDYGGTHPAGAAGPPVLFVPSLVNRAYILDLAPESSLLRYLAARGLRPLLVDWGRPDAAARGYDLSAYITGRLARALDAAVAATGAGTMPAIGYCMGGLLAAALAERRPDRVSALVALATPWDFHAEAPGAAGRMAILITMLEAVIEAMGELPVDILQALFVSLDPLLGMRKFCRFAGLDPDGRTARAFVALEDWLNDGIPLAGPVARESLAGWYGENTPGEGRWCIDGVPVRAEGLRLPSLHLIPSRDRIVPPASSRALAAAMPGAAVVTPPLGHIGMVTARGAESAAWQPLGDWLAARTAA